MNKETFIQAVAQLTGEPTPDITRTAPAAAQAPEQAAP